MLKALSPIFVLSLLLLTGCNPDPCAEVECQNGGVCVEGDCDCPEGFFGPECEFQLDPCTIRACVSSNTESCVVGADGRGFCNCVDGFEGPQCADPWNQKFPGQFTAQETCNGKQETFGIEVETGPERNQITLINFHNQAGNLTTSKIVGNLIRSSLVELYPQFMVYGRVQGVASRSANGDLSLSYQIATESDTLTCIATLQKFN